MFPDKLNERIRIGLPVHRKPFEVFKDSAHAKAQEQGHCVFSVFVEVSVEDSLIHEVQSVADVEQHPTKIMKLQRRKAVRVGCYCAFNSLSVCPDGRFATLLYLRDDRE